MRSAEFRVESNGPVWGDLWPLPGASACAVESRAVAITLAAKSFVRRGSEIRVVHVPTGEVLYRKGEARPLAA